MLPKLRRVSSLLRNNNSQNNTIEPTNTTTNNDQVISSTERLSSKSSSSSNRSLDEGNNVYVETLLYIVHVDDIDIPLSNDIQEETYDAGDEQGSISSRPLARRLSKRTTASFNERHQRTTNQPERIPIYTRPSFSFSNPLRRLNSLLKNSDKVSQSPSTPKRNEFPLCSSTAKKTSTVRERSYSQNLSNNQLTEDHDRIFPPPPPSFLFDDPTTKSETSAIIRATGPGLSDGFVDEQCHFDLNAPNAELQKLVIAVDGPSKADIQIEIVEPGIYRVFYTCQTPGIYHISLTYDGIHIHSSPYQLRLKSQPIPEQVVPPTLPPPMTSPTATIEPTEFYVNSACIVTVRPAVPCTIFQAFIQAPQKTVNLPITVHKSAKSECYEIYFVPTICGIYWLNVSLNHIPIIDNPCRLLVRSNSTTKPVLASGQGLFHAYTGETSQFFVSKSPNDPTCESGTFSVGISGPSTVFLDANETEHGYEFHYKPVRSGKYIITIKNGGKHIQGSPFICRVYNKLSESRTALSTMYETENDLNNETTTQGTTSCQSLNSRPLLINPITTTSTSSTNQVDLNIIRSTMSGDPSQVCVFGTGLYEAKPRRKTSFKIDASQAGPGLLLVGLYSSHGPSERLVVKRILPSSPGFIYKVSYRVRARGQYMLVILYGSNMEHVPGSPYLVIVE